MNQPLLIKNHHRQQSEVFFTALNVLKMIFSSFNFLLKFKLVCYCQLLHMGRLSDLFLCASEAMFQSLYCLLNLQIRCPTPENCTLNYAVHRVSFLECYLIWVFLPFVIIGLTIDLNAELVADLQLIPPLSCSVQLPVWFSCA